MEGLHEAFKPYADQVEIRGRGMVTGIQFPDGELADQMVAECFERGLIIENCGTDGRVIKTLCPLVITEDELDRGIEIIGEAAEAVFTSSTVNAGA